MGYCTLRSITASALRFGNGSFCFFFQKEALGFYLIPPGKMDGVGLRGITDADFC
jgi:hypothetical protein